MEKSQVLKILDVYDAALRDAEYLHLHAEYTTAEKRLQKMMTELSQSHRQDLEDYLTASVQLHHRLMALAIEQNF